MRIGITGYKGKLGSQLVSMGCEPVDYEVGSKAPLNYGLDCIINCAAVTNVDGCEVSVDTYWKAIRVNGEGVDCLADAFNGKIIHISSDYVFGGKRGPYSENYNREDDLPTKRMGYGVSKFVGEMFAKGHDNVHIVRTTGLYGGISKKSDFVSMILDFYNFDSPILKITSDLRGNQTYVPHLAEALIMCAERSDIPKILHIASKEVITRYEFALMIAFMFGLDKDRLVPVKSSQVPGWVAERPKKGGLRTGLAKKLGIPIYSILEGLEEYKNEPQRKRE